MIIFTSRADEVGDDKTDIYLPHNNTTHYSTIDRTDCDPAPGGGRALQSQIQIYVDIVIH